MSGPWDARNKSDLDRIGIARQEQLQDAKPGKITAEEALIRTMSDVESALRDLRKGLRTRWNAWDVYELDTAAAPATNGQGEFFNCRQQNGGIPWDSLTIDSVGGAGATMQVLINERGRWVPVGPSDVFDDGEIWSFRVRVTTGGAGTGRVTTTSYIPGLGGYKGL